MTNPAIGNETSGWRTRGAAVALAVLTLGAPAWAQRERDHDRKPPPPSASKWRGDISRFHEHDWHTWRAGRWVHSRHDGRLGWWWVAGGLWYFYPAPVYPYPNPWEPPPVVVAPPVETAPPTQYWYYCEASRAYYPYVATCPGGWKQVPATPPPTPVPQPK
jgi:hypothetical protein